VDVVFVGELIANILNINYERNIHFSKFSVAFLQLLQQIAAPWLQRPRHWRLSV
jgi:hypothetical protein